MFLLLLICNLKPLWRLNTWNYFNVLVFISIRVFALKYSSRRVFCDVYVECSVDTVKYILSTMSILVLLHLIFVWLTYLLLRVEYIVNLYLTSSHIHFMKLGTPMFNIMCAVHRHACVCNLLLCIFRLKNWNLLHSELLLRCMWKLPWHLQSCHFW